MLHTSRVGAGRAAMMRSVAPRSFLARAREVFDGLWNYGNEEYRMVRDLKDDIRKDTERIRKLTADTKAELNGAPHATCVRVWSAHSV